MAKEKPENLPNKEVKPEVIIKTGTIEQLKTAKGRKEWRESYRFRQEFIQSVKTEA